MAHKITTKFIFTGERTVHVDGEYAGTIVREKDGWRWMGHPRKFRTFTLAAQDVGARYLSRKAKSAPSHPQENSMTTGNGYFPAHNGETGEDYEVGVTNGSERVSVWMRPIGNPVGLGAAMAPGVARAYALEILRRADKIERGSENLTLTVEEAKRLPRPEDSSYAPGQRILMTGLPHIGATVRSIDSVGIQLDYDNDEPDELGSHEALYANIRPMPYL